MPDQHCRAGPEGVGVGDPTLRTRKQENWPHPLPHGCKGWTHQDNAGSSPWWWGQGRTGRLTNPATTQTQYQGYGLTHPLHSPHQWSAGECEGTGPADTTLQDFHNMGQQQDNQEEFQGGASIDNVEKPETSNQTNDSLQWALASKDTGTKGIWVTPVSHYSFHDEISPTFLFSIFSL